MDVYYDNCTKLLWMRDDIVRDFLLRGVSSHKILHDLNHSKGIQRYRSKDERGIREFLPQRLRSEVASTHPALLLSHILIASISQEWA